MSEIDASFMNGMTVEIRRSILEKLQRQRVEHVRHRVGWMIHFHIPNILVCVVCIAIGQERANDFSPSFSW